MERTRKIRKRIAGIFLTLILTVSLAGTGLGALNQDARNGIAVIVEEIVINGEALGYGMGTGFFVGESGKDPEYIVTNFHVIQDFLAAGGGSGESTLAVFFNSSSYEEVYVVDYDQEMDLAILRLSRPTDQRLPMMLKEVSEDSVGSSVYAIGFPAVVDNSVNAVSFFDSEDATVTAGSISRFLTESGTGRRIIQVDAVIHSGNSGGPLVDEDGNVIGINTFTLTDSQGVKQEGLNYAVNVQELIPLLNRNNIAYEMAGEGGMASGLPIPAIGAAAVAAVVILLVLVTKMRGSASARPNSQQASAQQPIQPAAAAQMGGGDRLESKTPVIRSMSPQHRGAPIYIKGKTVLVGRDPASCQLVYAEGTPGVSSRHCSISFDETAGDFLLTDLRSTYGTFLAGGQKLSPGLTFRLRSGDRFYVGDPGNVICVELR